MAPALCLGCVMDEIVQEFLVESLEGLDQLDHDFVELEKDPDNADLLANIFRCIHTVKGTCGFLGFSKLESVTHSGENLLSRLRDGTIKLTPEIISTLLALVDAVREIMACIESDGAEGDTDYSALIQTLKDHQSGAKAPPADSEPKTVPEPEAEAKPKEPEIAPLAVAPTEDPDFDAAIRAARAEYEAKVAAEAASEAATVDIGSVIAKEEPKPEPEVKPEPKPEPEVKAAPAPKQPANKPAAKKDDKHAVAESSIRVGVGLLDRLMNLVGELVLARNQVLQFSAGQGDTTFTATSQRLNLITSELQEGVMKTRMQPIGNVWGKFPRIVRDLAMACGKQVRIEMEGKQTELDKTLIEAIKDPLTHIVRNSVDHGLESPEDREAAGKSAEGLLLLRAYHEGGQVNIEIRDDGRGIDPHKILDKAISKGIVTPEMGARMSDREILNLVFAPGFSTAEKVTNISGRGVGMDVVRSNITRIGGTVDIQSTPGQGTVLKIKIPLTLAIIPALVVTCRGARYALPQVSLLELVRIEGDNVSRKIETVHGVPVYRLRGNLLPLVYLDETLGVTHLPAPPVDPDEGPVVNIVVLQADDQSFGLVVDDINDTEEIVVKPLGTQLKSIQVFAGATIMGDGRVALILDVMGLAQRSGVIGETRDRLKAATMDLQSREEELQALLLFMVGQHRRLAIPLSMVARLEEFQEALVEEAGDSEVVQYRGRILPLLRLSKLMGTPPQVNEEGKIQVVVYSQNGHQVGLVVDRIVDIIEDHFSIQACNRNGILGSTVIQDKVTDLLDVESAIAASGIPDYDEIQQQGAPA